MLIVPLIKIIIIVVVVVIIIIISVWLNGLEKTRQACELEKNVGGPFWARHVWAHAVSRAEPLEKFGRGAARHDLFTWWAVSLMGHVQRQKCLD